MGPLMKGEPSSPTGGGYGGGGGYDHGGGGPSHMYPVRDEMVLLGVTWLDWRFGVS